MRHVRGETSSLRASIWAWFPVPALEDISWTGDLPLRPAARPESPRAPADTAGGRRPRDSVSIPMTPCRAGRALATGKMPVRTDKVWVWTGAFQTSIGFQNCPLSDGEHDEVAGGTEGGECAHERHHLVCEPRCRSRSDGKPRGRLEDGDGDRTGTEGGGGLPGRRLRMGLLPPSCWAGLGSPQHSPTFQGCPLLVLGALFSFLIPLIKPKK